MRETRHQGWGSAFCKMDWRLLSLVNTERNRESRPSTDPRQKGLI